VSGPPPYLVYCFDRLDSVPHYGWQDAAKELPRPRQGGLAVAHGGQMMSSSRRDVLLTTFVLVATTASGLAVADEKLGGKVTQTNLTLCQPRPNGGGCEGTLGAPYFAGFTYILPSECHAAPDPHA